MSGGHGGDGASWLGELGREGNAVYPAASPFPRGSFGSVLADDRCRADPFVSLTIPSLSALNIWIQFKMGIYPVCYVSIALFCVYSFAH